MKTVIILSINNYDKILQDLIKEEIEKKIKSGEEVDKEKLLSAIKDIYSPEKIDEYAHPIYQSLLKEGPEIVEEDRLITQEFESRLQLRWSSAFYDLTSIIKIAEETAADIIDDYMANQATIDGDQTFVTLVFDVLMKLYSKAIVLSKEIKTLLKSGYADGAMSRWRSLHECNVYFTLLTMKYDDKEYTKKNIHKFYEYSIIEKHQELTNYYNKEKYFNLNSTEIKAIEEDYKEILNKYGNDFKHPYSWARCIFPNKPRIYFSDLEKKAGIDHLAIYYKQANYQIHTSPTGLYNSLGNIQDDRVKEYGFILGPSNYGLSIPGQLTMISLAQISTSLLSLDTNIDKMIRTSIFQKYLDRATVNFDSIQTEIEKESLDIDN